MADRLIHLRGGDVSLVLDAGGQGLPRVLHWGADLGEDVDLGALAAATAGPLAVAGADVHVSLSLVPERAAGDRGRPGLTGSRDGRAWSPAFRVDAVERPQAGELIVTAEDPSVDLALRSELRLAESGALTLRHTLRNDGAEAYRLDELACVLPIPPVAREVLDLTGRWCRERTPQRRLLGFGTWLRESRHGRTGHDAPLMLVAGTPGFSFRSGEVWGVHLGWSGDASTWAERLPDGTAVLGAAELLGPGELVLEPGQEYATPWLYAAWSARGLDGLSAAIHAWIRARPEHPRRPRPVVLNTWEAVYFNHRLDRLVELADAAARVGVERFVLDDGWFGARRDDTAGLGDWHVAAEVWPQGLGPLVEHVRGLGMEFGLWVEPEMVNPDSDLFRAHPDWVMQADPGRLPLPWRNEQVLDLANPDAYAHVRDRLDAVVGEYDIDYLKWDHNRDLVEAGHDGRPGVHEQTLAAYRLLDELRERHPGLEIESCSSGGARVDLGILARTDRVWASDTNDALERQAIQRWTQLLLPPELVGTHVGPPRAHTTGRTHALSFRVATALFGHFGIEWDIARATPEEQAALADAVAFYRRMRTLLHSGEVVRADHHDPAALVHGIVAQDRGEALFAYVQLTTSVAEIPGAARIPGLAAERHYRIAPVPLAGGPALQQAKPPQWHESGGVTLSGRTLATAGLEIPVLQPEHALLLHLTAA
ncbi:MAG: alpha-galactosidase [Thermoleophilaceae bacterium]